MEHFENGTTAEAARTKHVGDVNHKNLAIVCHALLEMTPPTSFNRICAAVEAQIRNRRTVKNCLDVIATKRALTIQHVGQRRDYLQDPSLVWKIMMESEAKIDRERLSVRVANVDRKPGEPFWLNLPCEKRVITMSMLEHLEKLRDSDIERKSLGWQKEQVGLGKLGPWNSDLDPRILLDDYLSKNNPAYHRELVRRSERRIVPGH